MRGTVPLDFPLVQRLLRVPPGSCRRAIPILYSVGLRAPAPVVPVARRRCRLHPTSAAHADCAPAVHSADSVPRESETQSAARAVRESPSDTEKQCPFLRLPLRKVDTAPATARLQPHQSFGEWADDIAARTCLLLCVQVFGGGPSVPGGRKARLAASRLVRLLLTAAASAQSQP